MSAPPSSEDFIRKTEEEVYKIAGVVRKDAEITGRLAVTVENITDEIKKDVIKVKDAVHEVTKEIEYEEKVVDGIGSTLNRSSTDPDSSSSSPSPSSSSSPTRLPPLKSTGTMSGNSTIGLRYWSVLSPIIHVVVAGISIVQLWPSFTSFTKSLTRSLIYGAGPLLIAFNLIRKLMTNEKKVLSKVAENVDIVADDIIKAADVVNNVAHMVERVSEEVEKDTDKVQQRMAGHKANQ